MGWQLVLNLFVASLLMSVSLRIAIVTGGNKGIGLEIAGTDIYMVLVSLFEFDVIPCDIINQYMK